MLMYYFYLISCANIGPSGSFPKSMRKSLSTVNPPLSVSTLIRRILEPFLKNNETNLKVEGEDFHI